MCKTSPRTKQIGVGADLTSSLNSTWWPQGLAAHESTTHFQVCQPEAVCSLTPPHTSVQVGRKCPLVLSWPFTTCAFSLTKLSPSLSHPFLSQLGFRGHHYNQALTNPHVPTPPRAFFIWQKPKSSMDPAFDLLPSLHFRWNNQALQGKSKE